MKSPLWNDILKLRSFVQGSISWQVGNGESVQFWLDRWCGESLLCIEFPNLFDIAYDNDISIAVAFHNSRLNIPLARQLT